MFNEENATPRSEFEQIKSRLIEISGHQPRTLVLTEEELKRAIELNLIDSEVIILANNGKHKVIDIKYLKPSPMQQAFINFHNAVNDLIEEIKYLCFPKIEKIVQILARL